MITGPSHAVVCHSRCCRTFIPKARWRKSTAFFSRIRESPTAPPSLSISKVWFVTQNPSLLPAKETRRSFWRKRKKLTTRSVKQDMQLELYFYNECGFSQSVLNCMTNLGCEDKIIKKNIRENPEYEKELVALCGAKTVPVLVIDGKPLRGSEEISQYLVGKFL